MKLLSIKSRNGATVVETIVALSILSVFIAGAAKVILSHRQLTDKARAHYTAINIAKNRIEHLRNMRRASFDQIFAMEESASDNKIVNKNGEYSDNGKFKRTTHIIKEPTIDGLLEVYVTVKIQNPVTLEFTEEQEHLKSYMAKLLDS